MTYRKSIAWFVVLALSSAAGYFVATMPSKDEAGQRYLDDLIELIEKSDEVRLVEHSDERDYKDSGVEAPNRYKELIYQSTTLTEEQEDSLISTLEAAESRVSNVRPACIFVSHHRLEFYRDDKLKDVMLICFKCGQIRWNGSRGSMPAGFTGALNSFVKSVGFHPERDWKGLVATAREEKP